MEVFIIDLGFHKYTEDKMSTLTQFDYDIVLLARWIHVPYVTCDTAMRIKEDARYTNLTVWQYDVILNIIQNEIAHLPKDHTERKSEALTLLYAHYAHERYRAKVKAAAPIEVAEPPTEDPVEPKAPLKDVPDPSAEEPLRETSISDIDADLEEVADLLKRKIEAASCHVAIKILAQTFLQVCDARRRPAP